MNILVNDSNQMVVQGITALVEAENHKVLGCRSLSESVNVLSRLDIHVFVTELISEQDDVEKTHEFLRRLQVYSSGIKVIILTELRDSALINFFSSSLHNICILDKNASSERMRECIYQAEVSQQTLTNFHEAALSRREFTLMKWFGSERSQREIAARLRLNPKTVSYYKRSIFVKLRCNNTLDFYQRLNDFGFCRRFL